MICRDVPGVKNIGLMCQDMSVTDRNAERIAGREITAANDISGRSTRGETVARVEDAMKNACATGKKTRVNFFI